MTGRVGPAVVTVLTAALAGTVLVSGCTSAPRGPASSTTTPSSTSTNEAAPAGTRWWSNGRDAVGSPVGAGDPAAAASALRPSRPVYCTMLRQTVARGQGLIGPQDDTHLANAFLAEITHVAPAAVAPSWRVLDAAIGDLLGGRTIATGPAERAKLRHAASRVGLDAKGRCDVTLSRSLP